MDSSLPTNAQEGYHRGGCQEEKQKERQGSGGLQRMGRTKVIARNRWCRPCFYPRQTTSQTRSPSRCSSCRHHQGQVGEARKGGYQGFSTRRRAQGFQAEHEGWSWNWQRWSISHRCMDIWYMPCYDGLDFFSFPATFFRFLSMAFFTAIFPPRSSNAWNLDFNKRSR